MTEHPPAAEKTANGKYRVDIKLIGKALIGLLGLLLFSYLCGVLLRDPIVIASKWVFAKFGLAGLFCGVIVTDASPLPMTNEPLMLLAVSAGVEPPTVFLTTSVASVTAGFVGYTCGRFFGRALGIGDWIHRRYPGFEVFMQRYGAYGVAICALLPIPFALSTWSAGMARVALWRVMLAALVRFPKTAFYLWLIVQGWGLGAS